jgi:hypothetical protein
VGGEELQQTLLAMALVWCGFEVSMVVDDYGQPDGAAWEVVRTFKAYRVDAGIPLYSWSLDRHLGCRKTSVGRHLLLQLREHASGTARFVCARSITKAQTHLALPTIGIARLTRS